jgi:hypothetical protein
MNEILKKLKNNDISKEFNPFLSPKTMSEISVGNNFIEKE